jgi:hypothetical protein
MCADMAAAHHYLLVIAAFAVLAFIKWRHLHLRTAHLRALQ